MDKRVSMTKKELDYFLTTPFIRMGRWALSPADSENWHTEHTSHYFKKVFGFGKGTLVIQTLPNTSQYCYFPRPYVEKLYRYIKKSTKRNYKSLEKKLLPFYALKKKAYREISFLLKGDVKKLSNPQLIAIYRANRDWAHRVTVYDQFGWIAEDYWNKPMEETLSRYNLSVNSPEYHDILFTLTKPRVISTTLEEKRAVLQAALAIARHKQNVEQASSILAKQYGWMPVFAYGTPWGAEHYREELQQLLEGDIDRLKKEYQKLKQYTVLRDQQFKKVIKKLAMNARDTQLFVDFGLVLDTRNEAEYLVSFTGFHLLPIYKEIARRLYLSIKQVRDLYEHEIIAALAGKLDAAACLEAKKGIVGWGFNAPITKRIFFSPAEAKRIFDHLERQAPNLQGATEGAGLCASPGYAKGKARIVMIPSENDKVEPGDILITEATTVDYLPAMKRAAAIVTEVGGLTCHAAVVSREFGIPCVVALKDATKSFKDGDIIEVIADKGLVKTV